MFGKLRDGPQTNKRYALHSSPFFGKDTVFFLKAVSLPKNEDNHNHHHHHLFAHKTQTR